MSPTSGINSSLSAIEWHLGRGCPKLAGDMLPCARGSTGREESRGSVGCSVSEDDYAATGVKRVSARVGPNSDWLEAMSFRRSLKNKSSR